MNTNKNIVIEKAKISDYEELRKLFLRVRIEEFHWGDKNNLKLNDFDINTKDELIFSAHIESELCGFISIWEEDNFIHNLFVSPNFRGCGVGKALLNYSLSILGTPLTLKCVKENTNALAFYLSQKWTILKEENGVEGPYYLMRYE